MRQLHAEGSAEQQQGSTTEEIHQRRRLGRRHKP
jgi:hypothetical protein